MPARYIRESTVYVPSINCHAVVIEFWLGSKRMYVSYKKPDNEESIKTIKHLYLSGGVEAVKEYERKRWNLRSKTVDTRS